MRPRGLPNKNKRGLRAQLRESYGEDFDVIMMMAENCLALHKIAQGHRGDIKTFKVEGGDTTLIDASSSAKTAIEALNCLAQYVEPKLKAIEHSGDKDHPIVIIKDLSGE